MGEPKTCWSQVATKEAKPKATAKTVPLATGGGDKARGEFDGSTCGVGGGTKTGYGSEAAVGSKSLTDFVNPS